MCVFFCLITLLYGSYSVSLEKIAQVHNPIEYAKDNTYAGEKKNIYNNTTSTNVPNLIRYVRLERNTDTNSTISDAGGTSTYTYNRIQGKFCSDYSPNVVAEKKNLDDTQCQLLCDKTSNCNTIQMTCGNTCTLLSSCPATSNTGCGSYLFHKEGEDPCVDIKLRTFRYGSEITWKFGSCHNPGNVQYADRTEYTMECCQPAGLHELDCQDSYGDGWHGGYIQIGDDTTKYCENFKSGHSQSQRVEQPNDICDPEGHFCGLSPDEIEYYLQLPNAVKGFISFGFGITFDIGSLTDHPSDSCTALGKLIGDVDMAWVNVDTADPLQLVADTTITRDVNYKKCKKRGKDENFCRSEEKMDTPKAQYAQKYNNLPFPICMAVRPCDLNGCKLFKEQTFGIHFGGAGVPIVTLRAVAVNLVTLAYSSTGHLTTSSFDEDLLPLLELSNVKHTSWGMRFYLEVSMDFPIAKVGGKDIFEAEANAGLGLFTMMKLRDGREISGSAADLFGSYLESKGDLVVMAERFRTGDSAIQSANFELNAKLDGSLTIKLGTLLGDRTGLIEDMVIERKARAVMQIHLERGNSEFQCWLSLQAPTNLKNLLQILPPQLHNIVPPLPVEMLFRIYAAIKESGEIDFVGAFQGTLKLDCAPFETLKNIWENLLKKLGGELGNTPLDPLIDMLQRITDFVDSVCSSGGVSVGVQLRVNTLSGIVPYDTFFEFQGNKLRLSDLPVCDATVHGVAPSPYSLEQAHDHPQSRCKTNDDCFGNGNSYKVGIYSGNKGYCLNHPNLYTVLGCLGRCIKKLAPGQKCDKDRMNIFHLQRLDFTNAEHAACQSGQCSCGVCTDGNHKIPDGGKCAQESDCQSGSWCEGDVTAGCKGICREKRENGKRAWHNIAGAWSASCKSGKEQCGTCVSSYHRSLPNEAYCSGYNQCQSGWCEGHVVSGCHGKCQRKRNNGEASWHGWQRSCHSGREQCGTCTSGSRDLPSGHSCSKNNNCRSNWCGCGWWGCSSVNCNGRCD